MANWFSSFIKKTFVGKNQNLVSFDDPYDVIQHLLKKRMITGIIDAGASDGHISRRLLRKFRLAHVYAFEPNPLYKEALQGYAAEEPRFHPQFAALSDREGTSDLYLTGSPGSASLFSPGTRLKQMDPHGASVKNLEKVQTVTVDQWAKRSGNLQIQLMKFDIQAGELKALRGAVNILQRDTFLVYTEIWFNHMYEGGAIYSEIDLFMRDCGFVLHDIFKPRYAANGLIMWANAMFIKKDLLDT